jgi:hypothetical protein
VVREVAKKLGKPVRSTAGGVADLIRKDYLVNQGHQDGGNFLPVSTHLFLYQRSWETWDRFDAKKVLDDQGLETIEDWQEWDGVDGTCFPFEYNIPFPRPK